MCKKSDNCVYCDNNCCPNSFEYYKNHYKSPCSKIGMTCSECDNYTCSNSGNFSMYRSR